MIDHHVSFHRNRSLWAVITNMAFLILNHVNDHHVFFHCNRSLALIIFDLKMGATHRLPWYTLDLSQWWPQQCSQCSLCSVFSVLHGRLGPGARQPDLQVIMTTDQSTISQSTKTTMMYPVYVRKALEKPIWNRMYFLCLFICMSFLVYLSYVLKQWEMETFDRYK